MSLAQLVGTMEILCRGRGSNPGHPTSPRLIELALTTRLLDQKKNQYYKMQRYVSKVGVTMKNPFFFLLKTWPNSLKKIESYFSQPLAFSHALHKLPTCPLDYIIRKHLYAFRIILGLIRG